MNELLTAYALGAFLGGATVFACLVAVILNLRTELFIREKQLNLYTRDECMNEKVEEEVVWIEEETMEGLAKALKEYRDDNQESRRAAYEVYSRAYGKAQKQILESVEKENKQNEMESNLWLNLFALRVVRKKAWITFRELPTKPGFQLWENINRVYLSILFGLNQEKGTLLEEAVEKYTKEFYG